MKKFFMVTPQQPEKNLVLAKYETMGNGLLAYDGKTRFPIVPLINGHAESGESIEVYSVTCDSDYSRRNFELLSEEINSLAERKKINCTLESIDAGFDDSVEEILSIFQKFINRMSDDDILHACITYGSKPMPLALVMAMQYAYRLKRNVSIECVVYGKFYGRPGRPNPMLYDVTALVKLDEIVRLLADRGVEDPESIITQILAL